MKKLLLTATLLGSFVAADAQYWNPYFANLDTTWGIRYMDAVDTSVVWAIGYDGTVPARTSNKFTRSIDGVNFVSGTFYADTNSFSPSNISVVDANTAYIATYFKAGTGTPGQILKTTDGGVNWNNVATVNMYNSAANFPNIVHFWDANNGWTQGDPNNTFGSGNEFEIWKTLDAGVNWTRVPGANIPAPLSGEYGTVDVYETYGSKFLWYGTNKGRVFRSADTGTTYLATQLTGMAGGVVGLAFCDSLNGLVWGTSSTATTATWVLRKTTDGGATFTNVTTGLADIGRAISAVPGTVGMYLSTSVNFTGSQYVTSYSTDFGLTWNIIEGGVSDLERVIELEVVDSLYAWGGAFSDNTLPYGIGGIRKNWGPFTTSLKPVAQANEYIVYPNPTSGLLTVKLDKVLAGTVIKVTDVMGKEVYSNNVKHTGINQEVNLNFTDLSKGIYIMNIVNGKNVDVRKIIIE